MHDDTPEPQTESTQPEGEAWKEVGHQFKELGQSLAAVFQSTWKDEEVRRQAQEMKTGLEALVKEVGQAIKETAESPEVKQVADNAVRAGRQVAREARPRLLEALRAMNRELQTLIERLETPGRAAPSEESEASAKE